MLNNFKVAICEQLPIKSGHIIERKVVKIYQQLLKLLRLV